MLLFCSAAGLLTYMLWGLVLTSLHDLIWSQSIRKSPKSLMKLLQLQLTDLHSCQWLWSGIFLPLSISFHLIDMPDDQRHRWTSWLSFSAAVALMHFISLPGLSVGVIKKSLQWHSTRRIWINSSTCSFSLSDGGTFYNIYIIYKVTGKGMPRSTAWSKVALRAGDAGKQLLLFLQAANGAQHLVKVKSQDTR